ncbi:MAG: hypothetical protein COV67_07175 [Nitrospinae bacterium CG11_big_fil_rev_8_21_14_0_20_56_8]|nr:MAG: hypothetical protein COV67_07175 [Nitrospinae bacterium CG11_big_fil_rev_8_21_14_0_20_56_8]
MFLIGKRDVPDQQGMSMVEMMIAMVIMVVVLGAAISLFVHQQSFLKDENEGTNIRAKGRHAINVLAKEIRMAGNGLPPNEGIQAMSTTSIEFYSNDDGVTTSTPTGAAGTVVATSGSNTLTVVDGSGFASGDNIVVYDPAFSQSHYSALTGASSSELTLGTAFTANFTYSENSRLVTVNKYKDITITQSGTNIVKTVDGSTTTLIGGGAANGLSFNFYGAATIADVTKVGITLNLIDPDNAGATIEFKTDVTLRSVS